MVFLNPTRVLQNIKQYFIISKEFAFHKHNPGIFEMNHVTYIYEYMDSNLNLQYLYE